MEEHINFRKTYLKFGIIFGLLSGFLSLALNITESFTSPLGNLPFLFLAIIIFLAFVDYKKKGDGFLNYSRSLGLGTLVGVVGSTVSGLISYIYTKFIDPSVVQKSIEAARQSLIEDGMPESQVDEAIGFTAFFTENPEISTMLGIITFALVAFIFSLVLGAIAKKNNPNPFE